jgi:hypothetical protein
MSGRSVVTREQERRQTLRHAGSSPVLMFQVLTIARHGRSATENETDLGN